MPRGRVEALYRGAFPDGKPHANQLDALTAMVDSFVRAHRNDGRPANREVLRSIPQMVRAFELAGVETREGAADWAPSGSVKEDRRRFRKVIALRLGYLLAMGLIERWEPVYGADGRGRGILVVLTADVAQLAAAPLKRRTPRRPGDRPASSGVSSAPARRRSYFSGTNPPPPTGMNSVVSAWKAEKDSRGRGGASASAAPASTAQADAIERSDGERARAALAARAAIGLGREPVHETLAALPWLPLVDAVALAQAVLRVHRPDLSPAISRRSARRLVAAVRRLDRYADVGAGRQGAGVELLIAAARSPEPPWDGAQPARSLGAVAMQLDRLSKKWRRAHKRRKAGGQ